ncbi:16S rRNA (adenine(1518)-N(6)/adenine(1519)-N(6))-dimethyltransferase RsmA [Patescibacteria group bacterium]
MGGVFKKKAKKSLGQNFLKDEKILDDIIKSSELSSNDCVLEIGPGQGALTERLVETAKKVVAFELDQELIPGLLAKFKNNDNLEIVHKDILQVNLGEELKERGLEKGEYRVIANIPYYITSKIARLFLESEYSPKDMIIMVQKEVAHRMAAEPGKMSLLAVSVQYFAEAEVLFNVSRDAFEPVPNVDSAIIRIHSIRKEFDADEAKKFFRVVKAGFCARRKTLVNNLSNSLHIDKREVQQRLEDVGIDANTRAQELSIDEWKKLAEIF